MPTTFIIPQNFIVRYTGILTFNGYSVKFYVGLEECEMKKRPVLVCVTVMCFILFCNFCNSNVYGNKKEHKGMDVVSTHGTKFTNYFEESIVVILNGYEVTDFETCSLDIIQNVIDDNFYSTCFDWSESG